MNGLETSHTNVSILATVETYRPQNWNAYVKVGAETYLLVEKK